MDLTRLKLRCQKGCIPAEPPGKNVLSRLFRLLEAASPHSSAHGPWPFFSNPALQHLLISHAALLPPSFTYKSPCDYIGLTEITQDLKILHLTTSAKSHLPGKVTTYSKVAGIKTRTSLGATILPTTVGHLLKWCNWRQNGHNNKEWSKWQSESFPFIHWFPTIIQLSFLWWCFNLIICEVFEN